MTSLLRNFTGSCHCGALGVSFHTGIPPSQWSVRACQCSFCRAHGAMTTSDTAGRLVFLVHRPKWLRRYRFGLRTADFLVCGNCGVYVGAQIETPRGSFGTLNVLAITPGPDGLPAAAPADYGAESPSERVGRRAERWTPLEMLV